MPFGPFGRKSRKDVLLASDYNDIVTVLEDVYSIEDVEAYGYSTGEVDALFSTQVAGINARPSAWAMRAGERYNTFTHGTGRAGTVSGGALVADRIYFTPIYVPAAKTFDRIGITVTTGVAASTARLGIFSLNLTSGDATLLLDAGTVSTVSAADVEATINQSLDPGWWWLGLQPSAAISIQAAAAATGYAWSTSGAPLATRLQTGGASGAFSATETTNTNSTTAYCTYLRAA